MELLLEMLLELILEGSLEVASSRRVPLAVRILLGIVVFGFYFALLALFVFIAIAAETLAMRICMAAICLLLLVGMAFLLRKVIRRGNGKDDDA